VTLRRQTPYKSQILSNLETCLQTLYQGQMRLTEQLLTSEWAMIGACGDGTETGDLPAWHRLSVAPEVLFQVQATNLRMILVSRHRTMTREWIVSFGSLTRKLKQQPPTHDSGLKKQKDKLEFRVRKRIRHAGKTGVTDAATM
jgi:hypothetical protein